MILASRVLRHLARKRNARHFRVPYHRYPTFKMPPSMHLGGRTIDVSAPDEFGARMDFLVCFIDDEYGLREVDHPVSTVVDIGSNVGFFSLAARDRFPSATIHAYEPNPRTLAYLTRNGAAAGIEVFPEAVGATAGTVWLEDTGDSNQARIADDATAGTRVIQVPLADVVERLGGWIDLAKIDCEGAEWEMFQDGESWRRIGLVRMEYHLWKRRSFEQLVAALSGVGFSIHHHKPDVSGEWGTVWARNTSTAAASASRARSNGAVGR